MAYDPSNPPALKTQRVGAAGGATYYYSSIDAATTVKAKGYFSNAAELGMKLGDIVESYDNDSATLSIIFVNLINVTDGEYTCLATA